MKKNLLALLMIAALIFATSCNKDDVEEPALTLAESEWQAPMEAAEKTVAVNTNQTNWTAAPNAEWIETTQTGNSLTIKVTKNVETKTRKAIVKVIAGGIGKEITVTQAATNVTIVTIPDKLEVDQWGGNYQFDVDANTKDWTITSDADWAKVTPKQFKGEVAVEIAENVKREARVAKLTLTGKDGKGTKEFAITQSGIIYYILPYLERGASYEKVKQFEFSRKSTEVIDQDYIDGKPGSFNTMSPAFPRVTYAFAKNKLSKISLVASSSKVVENAEFAKMMTDAGFKPSGKNYTKDVAIGTKEYTINALVVVDDAENGVVFSLIPKQSKDMPTWSIMPLGFTGFGKGKAEIDKYEKANGGKYNTTESAYLDKDKAWFHWYDVKTPELLARAYFVMDDAKEGLVETAQYYTNRDKVFYEVEEELFFTREFTALATKEGFTYIGFVNEWHRFENATKNLIFLTRWVKYRDIEQPVLDCHVFQKAAASSTSVMLPDSKEEYKPFKMNSWEARGTK